MGARELACKVFVADNNGEMHSFGPGDDLPKWAREQITNPAAWGEDDPNEPRFGPGGEAPTADDEAQGDEVMPYAKWKKADLEAEVEKRNADRDDEDLIVVGGTGKVSDLADALDADDEAQGE